MINGNTELIAHIGFPTHAFKAPMIYNPWFEKAGVNAVVVPMGCQAEDYPVFLRAIFKLSNIRGALITMPHKVPTTSLVDELLPTAAIAGACNAVRLGPTGQLQGDMFDGEGFVRGVLRKQVGELAERVRIQYGGSVKPSNAAEIFALPEVDGARAVGPAVGGHALLRRVWRDRVSAYPAVRAVPVWPVVWRLLFFRVQVICRLFHAVCRVQPLKAVVHRKVYRYT